ncbi:MAG: D-glycerate dehydrogenase [bacterium]|nr:D-glycerate dehydrogenase [bacterium]MDZ4232039.1 D-glycerate dehydrogenase [Candidatus Pacearchaeota archaeon]
MKKVFSTRQLPGDAFSRLRKKGYQVQVGSRTSSLLRQVFMSKAKGADALITLLTDRVDGEVMDAVGRQLKVVANYAVGFDNIDLAAAAKRGIRVTNTPGVLAQAVAEHTVALLLSVVRRIPESERFLRKKLYRGWEPELFLGAELAGKTLGLVGHGRVGCRVADILKRGFDMNVLYYDVVRDKKAEGVCGIQYVSFIRLLREADVVSLHVPLFASTRHLISSSQLRTMKKTAYLVNTSRGPIVEERALVSALKKKEIAGAALDVFENEPRLAPGLVQIENAVLTPHTGSATVEARTSMADLVAENVIAVLSGKNPPNLVHL